MIRQLHGDCRSILPTLPDASVHCIVTSPPYFALRSYLDADHPDKHREIGSERTPDEYLATMVGVFREVRRVLRPDGVCWVNMGDSYNAMPTGMARGKAYTRHSYTARSNWATAPDNLAKRDLGFADKRVEEVPGLKPKDLQMMPARLAIALQADGWWLRSMLPWLKRSAMPESVTDRPASAVEYVFLLTKSARYFWDAEACKRSAVPDPINARTFRGGGAYTDHRSKDNGTSVERASHGNVANASSARNMRNSDLFYDSLEDAPEPAPKTERKAFRTGRAYASNPDAVGQYVWPQREAPEPLGLICDDAGSPLALDVNPAGFSAAHFATFSPRLVEPLIRAGCPLGGTVLDPFSGAGTTLLVADRLQRDAIGIELNPAYGAMADERIVSDAPLFAWVEAAE